MNSNYILQHIKITVASKTVKPSGGSGGGGFMEINTMRIGYCVC